MPLPSPLVDLFDRSTGSRLPLPRELTRLCGEVRFPRHVGRPHVIANFASTVDGIVSLGGDGPRSGGSAITALDPHDRMMMGLLRAVSDVVVVGAGTFRAVPHHVWTPEATFAPLGAAYASLRTRMGLAPQPRLVVVSASGKVDPRQPAFQVPHQPSLIVTTPRGKSRLLALGTSTKGTRPGGPQVWVGGEGPRIRPSTVLRGLARNGRARLILLEGGPSLLADFLQDDLLDELFLTVAPQVAGRDGASGRRGLVEGRTFGPDRPLWGKLRAVRRGGDLLFLRYGFGPGARAA